MDVGNSGVDFIELMARSEAGDAQATDQVIAVLTEVAKRDEQTLYTGALGYHAMLRYVRHGSLDDLQMAVVNFKKALAATAPNDPELYGRALNMAWASEARFDRLRARGEQYMVIQIDGVERYRGPRDLVHPISVLENLVAAGRHPPCPRDVLPRLKRNLGNLLSRYAQFVQVRPVSDRQADARRAIAVLSEAMLEVRQGSDDELTVAVSLIATIQQCAAAGLIEVGPAGAYEGVDPATLERAGALVADPS